MALNRVGSRTIAAIRQPSLGPVFGIKGGAAGGGYAQVVPMEDFNLHLTGDVHAISLAHNLLAAMIDNSITHGNKLRIDPLSITWPRVVDVSDRALRKIVIGLGGRENGHPRETGFDISVASEVMAILGLTTSLKDFRQRLGRIVIGLDQDGQAVTAEELGTAGAMAVLLRDAIKPTLLQTIENTPVFVHAGPFANIAHGNSSIIADLIGLKLADCVVTESGFGADMGMEKFMNIKCRYSGLVPDAVVMVCTVRALKMHSGRYRVVAGRPLDPGLTREDLKAVEDGCANLDKQIENARSFGVPVVVAINAFATDTAGGGRGDPPALDRRGRRGRPRLRGLGQGRRGRRGAGARRARRGRASPRASASSTSSTGRSRRRSRPSPPGSTAPTAWTTCPRPSSRSRSTPSSASATCPSAWPRRICRSRTTPRSRGGRADFRVPIREVRASMGAGFLYPLLGEMRTMPGLPSEPNTWKIDLDDDGNVVGLF